MAQQPRRRCAFDQMLHERFSGTGFTLETAALSDVFARELVQSAVVRLASDLVRLQKLLGRFTPKNIPGRELVIVSGPWERRFEHLMLDILNEHVRRARAAPLDEDFLEGGTDADDVSGQRAIALTPASLKHGAMGEQRGGASRARVAKVIKGVLGEMLTEGQRSRSRCSRSNREAADLPRNSSVDPGPALRTAAVTCLAPKRPRCSQTLAIPPAFTHPAAVTREHRPHARAHILMSSMTPPAKAHESALDHAQPAGAAPPGRHAPPVRRACRALAAVLALGMGTAASAAPRVGISDYGVTADGRPVHAYTLSNGHGVSARILDCGGIIGELDAPHRRGRISDYAPPGNAHGVTLSSGPSGAR